MSKSKDPITISTIGDSLTEGNVREAIIGDEISLPNTYQFWTYKRLKELGIASKIINFGIGGQIIGEICQRFVKLVVPADYIILMGGTNDVWRYCESAEGIEKEIAEEALELYEDVIKGAFAAQEADGKEKPVIFVNAIPPVGDAKSAPKKMKSAILYVNQEFERFVTEMKDDHVVFCDVHKAMRNDDLYMKEGLTIEDGVHFTTKGNYELGFAVANRIQEYMLARK
jgi:lysophospholipase L1-like esterase